MSFIKEDLTDTNEYIKDGPDAYVCADFAENVHNNAEAAGIRAGWVSLTFEGIDEGHALNAFETVDRGLVYIDCTNGREFEKGDTESRSWDMIAYIEIGKKYGVLHIDRVIASDYEFYSLQYKFYVEYAEAWQNYSNLLDSFNEEVDRYNREVAGKVYIIGSPEGKRITAWKEELTKQEKILKNMQEELGNYWHESEYSSYNVKNVVIHW